MESSSDTKNDSVIYVPNWIYTYLCVCAWLFTETTGKRQKGWMAGEGSVGGSEREEKIKKFVGMTGER